MDYLLKPVPFERFLKAVNKVYSLFEEKKEEGENFFFVKSGKQYKKIFFDEILFIESLENYVVIHTANAKDIVHSTLKNMITSLPSGKFLQIHRSYIINSTQIRSIEGNQLIIGTDKIPVSKSQREEIFRTLLKNRLE
ncbi:MAG: response regulator transcription factor [Tannerellaceae bacterium]|nr:response regulator transcription factor [Tannerellaceae bacterium]